MRFSTSLLLTSSVIAIASSHNDSSTGYDCYPYCIQPSIPVTNSNFSFGQHYAVLNLDLTNALVGVVANTASGQAFINSTTSWIDTVHAQKPAPLSIFTRFYFSNSRKPEIRAGTPLATAAGGLGNASDPATKIYPAFKVDEAAGDVVLQKTRYYAGGGNSLEEILATQQIDTVILSGISTSGVILSSVYRLIDLNHNVYVIANNTYQPGTNGQQVNTAILEGIIPGLFGNVITVEQAKAALKRSGPVVY